MRRVAVTGLGVVSPLGSDIGTLWDNLIQGKSGIVPIEEFSDLPVTFGGRAQGFDPSRYLGQKELRHMDRYAQMALTAGLDAYHHARLSQNSYPPQRIGVMIGSGSGGMATIESQIQTFLARGARRVSPVTVPMFITNMASAECSIRINAKGPGMGITSACATGGHALALASRLIQAGDADCMLAGGVEACLTPFSLAAFAAMRALSTRNDAPEAASRPFSIDRDGFVMAEGGGVLVLEEYTHARERGAEILAVLEGSGMSQDAHHVVAPDPEGDAVVYAIERAVKNAGIEMTDIGYINAHGTSTPLNDVVETLAIKRALKDHAFKVPVSSTKSMTGHLIGGAAGLETIICVLVLKHGVIPPTINLDNPDPECNLHYVPNKAEHSEVSYCLNNSFGFGGQNVALILGKDRG
ncbi:MAG: beta-ketoacyl-ACP synthase II [Bacteriovoracaceae bacterium]|nr:beta-ketoacyl-ACP synthase II [Bacteriovoracaceae bacterium]HNR50827.1 beta-ketoacyl-ACP synthase II [Deltaproteobacteria bacterium]HQO80355.1 beta-ketoacyl-ACP synthase II [Deltaproteobacteria bacterium]HRC99209.1 beta-ketoacyl-ACP synthase II [Deltaproteobacteria bacterium]